MCEALESGQPVRVFTVEAPHGVGLWEKVPEFQAYKPKMISG
jgi:hypothetical protein